MLQQTTMEPELTQAVRIVLKYEIQSLLSRLSDTGEEYIVLTASTDDKTCGHIGSLKGEGFVQHSGLHSVKQDFLNFCTGKSSTDNKPITNVVSLAPPVSATPSSSHSSSALNQTTTTALVAPRPHRRKSTPRCKLRKPVVDHSQSGSSRPTECSTVVESVGFLGAKVKQEPQEEQTTTALDLSEKTTTTAYSYTLDDKLSYDKETYDKQPYGNGLVAGTMAGFVYEQAAMKTEYGSSDFTPLDQKNLKNDWMEEKIELSADNMVPARIKPKIEPKPAYSIDTAILKSPIDISSQIPAVLAAFSQNVALNTTMKTSTPRSRRKPRRAPIKKSPLSVSFAGSVSPVAMNNNNNEVPNYGSLVKVEGSSEKKPGSNTLLHITQNYRNQRGRKSIDLLDMKSAFEEIGNMAKCLICNKILANKNNRTFHWRSHVGDKRYSCDICHKAFTHPSNMRSHRKIHTDEKPFPCNLCDRRFRRRDYLLQHLERFHYNPKSTNQTEPMQDSSNISMLDGSSLSALDGTSLSALDGSGLSALDGSGLSVLDGTNTSVQDGSSFSMQDGDNVSVQDGGNVSVQDGGNVSVQDGGNVSVQDGGNVSMQDGGNVSVQDGGNVSEDGSNVSVQDGNPFSMQDGDKLPVQDVGGLPIPDGEMVCVQGSESKSI